MASKAAKSIDDLDVPEWFIAAVEELKPVRSLWCKNLPEIVLRDQTALLPASHPWIMAALRHMEAEAIRHDLVDLLKRHADLDSLDSWMAAALQAWLEDGTPENDAWILPAAGYLGRDSTVRCVRDAVRKWTREKQRTFAVRGLDALSRIGSKLALDEIATLAVGLRDHSVADDAQGLIAKKGEAQGISREEMADRHVITCGLDSRGERLLSYGPRSFRVVFGNTLGLTLFGEDGKPRRSLPPPAATDDPVLTPAAKEAWKEMKTGVTRVVKAQQKRLEQSMITGRTWAWPDFQQTMLSHPILSRIAQLILWQTAAEKSQMLRVTEDLTLANLHDESVSLDEAQQLRVAHPLRMQAEELKAWTALFSDYKIVQPFSQLTRTLYGCDPVLHSRTLLQVPPHEPLQPGVLYGVLDNDGWRLGRVADGLFTYSWKTFLAEKVTAAISYSPGLVAGSFGKSPLQVIRHCTFHSGMVTPEAPELPGKPLKLGDVPPVPFTESLRRLLRLTAEKI
jgi:hypothetical protein